MARFARLILALACFGWPAAGAVAAPEQARTVTLRVYNVEPRPEELRLSISSRSSERDEGNFYAVFSMRSDASRGRDLLAATVVDLVPDSTSVCPEAACTIQLRDDQYRYNLRATVVDRWAEYLIAVRAIDPAVTVTGRGWAVRKDVFVDRFGTVSGSGGTRTMTPAGVAREHFVGIPPTKPRPRTVAWAMVPCEHAGDGVATLRAGGRPVAEVTCNDEFGVARYAAAPTTWDIHGSADGVTSTFTRLLVVGVR